MMSRVLRIMTQSSIVMLLILLACASEARAQATTVTGVIKDEVGGGLPGATIIEKGSAKGTVSDADGKFSLTVSNESAILVISFIGYTAQEVALAGRSSIEVTMALDITSLEEVVVIGYGTQKKSDLTGSIVSVVGDDLKKMPVSSVAESLTGRMAGVQVSSTEGSPDADVRIRVRGGGSISQDNSPLYIVDGFPVNTISDISPSDIKSIDVLKDASSTAIYGSRGANGVVIITTKGGTTDGKMSISYNVFGGVKKLANELDVLSPEDYVKWQYEYALLEDDVESYTDYFGNWQDYDLYKGMIGNNWQQQVYGRTGNVFSHDLSIRGGTEKLNYSANYARFDERAIMIGSDFNRNNLTLKLNNKPHDKVDLSFSLRYSHTKINGGGANEQNEISSADSRLKHAVTYSPIPISGITTDETSDQIASYMVNPIVATNDNDRYQERKNFNMAASFGWKILDELQFKTEVGLDTYGYTDNRFYGLSTYYVSNIPLAENQDQPAVILKDRKDVRWRVTNTLNYNLKKFLGDDHKLNILLGQEAIKTEVNEMTSAIHGFPKLFTADQAFRLTTQGSPQSVSNDFRPDDKLLSFFTRANYDYLGRYLLSATFRADGSSKFLGNNRWGYFPSAAFAWKLSEENFMASTANWLNSLKLRVSYGEAGNNNIPVGQTVQTFESSNNTWINGFDSYWSASKTMANPDLMWETTITRNIGLDFGLLKSRLSGSFEFYKNNTKDLLIRFPTPGTGYTDQFRNMGETENKGVELSLNYAAIDKQDYGLNFSFNVSFNRNEVVSIGGMTYINGTSNWASTAIGPDYRVLVGQPLGLMYGYVNDGRYEVSDFDYDSDTDTYTLKEGVTNSGQVVGTLRPGMMKLKDQMTEDTPVTDVDGDGIPDVGDGIPDSGNGVVDAGDLTIIGNANPKHTGGFIINGFIHGFDLTASFNWSYGNDVYNANKIEYTTSTPQVQYRNLIDIMADGSRWTNINANGELVTDPAALETLNANTTMWSPYMSRYVFSDWAVEDGSFLRLNTLTLGYTLPTALISKARIKSLRVYGTAYNVFVLTNYSGFDPEVSTRRNTPYTPGVDYSAYPRSRQFVLGLNLTF